jgi:hypothetical protein
MFHVPAAYAMVWISRASLPVTIALLRDLVRAEGGSDDRAWAAVMALLP